MSSIGAHAGKRPDHIGSRTSSVKRQTPGLRNTRALGAWACFAAFILVYINLIPFDYRPVPFDQAVERFRHLEWQQIIVLDRARWFSNVMQFVPFGFFGCGAIGRRSHLYGAIAAAVLGALLATGLEFAQIWVPPRTVALDDIIAELIGTAFGIVCWILFGNRLLRTIRTAVSGGPESLTAVLYIYLGCYVFVFLHPFDFLVGAEEIGARLAGPDAIIWPQRSALTWHGVAYVLLKIGLMVPAGAAANLVWRRGPIFATVAAMAFAWMIEIVHLFEQSAGANPINIVTAGVGAAIGHQLVGLSTRVPHLRRLIRFTAWAAIPFYLAALVIARDWRPGLAKPGDVAELLRSLHWIPLYYDYFAPSNQNAFASIVSIAAIFAPVGALFWGVNSKSGDSASGSRMVFCMFLAAVLCGLTETGRLLTAGLRPDPTNILIAAGSAALALRFCDWAARVFPDLLRREAATR